MSKTAAELDQETAIFEAQAKRDEAAAKAALASRKLADATAEADPAAVARLKTAEIEKAARERESEALAALEAAARREAALAEMAAARAKRDPLAVARAQRAEEAKAARQAAADELTDAETRAKRAAALNEAEAANVRARIGIIPAAPAGRNSVEVQSGGGKAEAAMLTAFAARTAAEAIVARVPADGGAIVVAGGEPQFAFGRWEQFDLAMRQLDGQLDRAAALVAAAGREVPVAPETKGITAERSVSPGTLIGAGLDTAARLAQYFQTNHVVGEVAVEADDAMLVAATAGALLEAGPERPVFLLPLATGKAFDAVTATLEEAAAKAGGAALDAEAADAAAAALRIAAGAEAEAGEKARLLDRAEAHARAASACRAAVTAFEAFALRLLKEEADGALPVARIAEQRALADKLADGAHVLFVRARAPAGGYYTRSNLWASLFGVPVHVAGGLVTHFTLIGGADRAVRAAGIVPIHSGYRKLLGVAYGASGRRRTLAEALLGGGSRAPARRLEAPRLALPAPASAQPGATPSSSSAPPEAT